jgi:hypothetical protein
MSMASVVDEDVGSGSRHRGAGGCYMMPGVRSGGTMSVCGSSYEDQDETSCPFCTGDVPSDIVDRIMGAAAGSMSRRMSVEEFKEWLDRLVPSS